MSVERTLALLKPDVTTSPWIQIVDENPDDPENSEKKEEVLAENKGDAIIARIQTEGFRIVKRKCVQVNTLLLLKYIF